MLVQQLLHRLNQSPTPAGVLFLDLAHAYDYISQDFILTVMHTMNFPKALICAVKTLMTNQSGRVLVNNDLSPSFPVWHR